ncbi:serine/threonine-protein kinase [Nannocystis bainbridge]|uniref:Serine/threonine-protein kinase n=1 Tax=Nannocystis bainbridge TaxID=2995303 RepID=A0ABT5EAN8_9BACT|nr:serine/threonine-protein kinase [Nannocystis bainbridge]MDC0722409.1 serine/threonine-protein kinase [Nannocystis bainbridge]
MGPTTAGTTTTGLALTGLGDGDPVEAALLLRHVEERMFGAAGPVMLGHYQLQRLLGVGGFGAVYLAHDPRLERGVAIKLMRQDREAAAPELLLREAQAMARLSHPNVLTVHDVGTYTLPDGRGGLFVVMEHVDGETLAQWLAGTRRPWPAIVETFLAAGRGLAAAHAIGLCHRDFKPQNVLIGRDGGVRVADFGLARRVGEASGGGLAGTPGYMAPELFAGDPGGPAADQFALCVALYEALYAAPPFPSRDLQARLRAIRGRDVGPVPEDSDVPGWLQAAIVRGLDPEPGRRHASMADLLRALDPGAAPRGIADVGAIRARIALLEPGVIRYHEIPLPSEFSVQVMRAEMTRLTSDGAPYTLLVELDEANMPGPEIRRHIVQLFADPHLVFVALLAGGDPVKVMAATLIVGAVQPRERFAMFDARDGALAACRAALAAARHPSVSDPP